MKELHKFQHPLRLYFTYFFYQVKTPDNRLVPPMTPPTSAKKRILELPPCTPGKIAKVEGDGGIFSTDAYFRGLQIMPPSYSLPNLHKHLFGNVRPEVLNIVVTFFILLGGFL